VGPVPYMRNPALLDVVALAEFSEVLGNGLAVLLRYRLGNDRAHLAAAVFFDLTPHLQLQLLEHRQHLAVLFVQQFRVVGETGVWKPLHKAPELFQVLLIDTLRAKLPRDIRNGAAALLESFLHGAARFQIIGAGHAALAVVAVVAGAAEPLQGTATLTARTAAAKGTLASGWIAILPAATLPLLAAALLPAALLARLIAAALLPTLLALTLLTLTRLIARLLTLALLTLALLTLALLTLALLTLALLALALLTLALLALALLTLALLALALLTLTLLLALTLLALTLLALTLLIACLLATLLLALAARIHASGLLELTPQLFKLRQRTLQTFLPA